MFAFQLQLLIRRQVLSVVAVVLLSLVACGGGGGSSSTAPSAATSAPASPNLSLALRSAKTLAFAWSDVAEESDYRLLEDASGSGTFSTVATLAADSTSHERVVLLALRLNARYILQACNAAGCSNSTPVSVGASLGSAIGYLKASNPGLSDNFGIAIALSHDGATLAVGSPSEDSDSAGVNPAPNEAGSGSGAVYVFVRNGSSWAQQAFIKASVPKVGDRFGNALALSDDGNTLVVGAQSEDSSSAGVNGAPGIVLPNAGAAYVFVRTAGAWSQQAHLTASNAGADDAFGWSVDVSGDGNTIAVGARMEDSSSSGVNGIADDVSSNTGAVYVFARSAAGWAQQAYIKASNSNSADFFGEVVELSADGNTLAVGAPFEDGSGSGINPPANVAAPSAGAAYVFVRAGGIWTQEAYVKASNTGANDNFGTSLALSADGNTLAVGAPLEDSFAGGVNVAADDTSPDAGAAYVFVRIGSGWTQQAYVKASRPAAGNGFGTALSLSADGHVLAVGAYGEGGSGTGLGATDNESLAGAGAAYVFARSGVIWTQQAYVKATNSGASDSFGYMLALSGDGATLAVGAFNEDGSGAGFGPASDDGLSNAGAVYLY